MFITVKEITGPDDEVVNCGYIELDADGYLVLPNDKVGSLALSFWVKSNTNANIYVSDKSSTSVNDWRRVSFVFVSDGSDVEIKFSPANYYIYKVKLEKGSKITDWSLSPDDVADGINSLSVRMSKAEQLISPEGIISTVKNSEMYQDDINGIKGRLDEAELKITSDAIVSTVKAGIDGSYLASEINQSAGKVLIKANCIELDGETIAEKLTSQIIKSSNYVEDRYGTMIDLNTGIIKSKLLNVNDSTVHIGITRTIDHEDKCLVSVCGFVFTHNGAIKYVDTETDGAYRSIDISPRYISISDEQTGSVGISTKSGIELYNANNNDATIIMRTNGDMFCGGTLNAANIQINGTNISSLFAPVYGSSWYVNTYQGGLINNIVAHANYQVGLYSNSTGQVIRPYIVGNQYWSNAVGNNSFPTRIYGSSVWASGTISTSDRRLKKDFEPFNKQWETFFKNLKPKTHRMLINSSNRRHTGYIAQEVKEALDIAGLSTQDFGGYIEDDGVDIQYFEDALGYQPIEENDKQLGLRYEEFIPLNTYMIQKLYKRVEELEAKLANS